MDASVQTVQSLLDKLNPENLQTALRFIQFLQQTQKEKTDTENLRVFEQLQDMFKEDKGGYSSEEDMISDLAQFRRGRLNR